MNPDRTYECAVCQRIHPGEDSPKVRMPEPRFVPIEQFLDEQGRWQCIRCAACCLHAEIMPGPEFDRGDGVCKYIDSDNACAIYEYRPWDCRTARLFTWTEREKAQGCALLLERAMRERLREAHDERGSK